MSSRFSKTDVAIGLSLVAAGAALRFAALGRHSLWTDEFFTLRDLRLIPASYGTPEATPPLYFLLLRGWTAVAGTGAAGVRAFSAVWGVLGVLVAWRAAARVLGPRAGLFALALVALSPFHLAYSQEARPYAMLFALSAASFYCIFRVADFAAPEAAPRRWWVAYAACTTALLYTHYWGLFVWLAGAIYALDAAWPAAAPAAERAGRRLRLLVLLIALPVAAFLLHVPALMASIARYAPPEFWTPAPSLRNLGSALVAFSGTRFYVGGWLFSLDRAAPVGVALFAALWLTGLLKRAGADRAARIWLACAVAGALLVPFAVSFFLPQMFVWWRYTMAAFPALIWLAARGWSLWPAAARAASAAALLLLLAAGDLYYFTDYRKGNIKQAAELVHSLPAGETVLIIPAYLQPQWDFYYRGRLPAVPEAGIDEMAPQLEKYQRAVFVTLDVPNPVKDAMDRRYTLVAQRRYPADFHLGLVVAVYRLSK